MRITTFTGCISKTVWELTLWLSERSKAEGPQFTAIGGKKYLLISHMSSPGGNYFRNTSVNFMNFIF